MSWACQDGQARGHQQASFGAVRHRHPLDVERHAAGDHLGLARSRRGALPFPSPRKRCASAVSTRQS